MEFSVQAQEKPLSLRNFILVLLVAGTYFIFGLLGLFLAVPPSNAGVVWPPAGIALAALLLFGKQVFPGVFIGNLLISAWAFGFATETSIIYPITGLGATLNALAGYYLIHRFVGFPNQLMEDKSILYFLLLGGPVSCLIPATIGITSMALTDVLATQEIPVNWFSWWVGDTIGVLLFTPLMLILFGQPRKIWRKRKITVGLPLTVTFILVIIFFLFANHLNRERQQQRFTNVSKTLTQALTYRIKSHLNAFYSLRTFFLSSQFVEKDEFTLFTKQPLTQFIELESLQWNLIDQDSNNKSIFTPLYSETKSSTAQQGGEIQSLPHHFISQDLIAEILKFETNLPQYQLNNISYSSESLHYFLPVYDINWPESVSPVRLKGLIAATVSIPDLITESFKGINRAGILLSVRVAALPAEKQLIYSEIGNNTLPTDFRHPLKQLISVGNDQWLLEFKLDSTIYNTDYHWAVWWVLIGGLIFTSILGVGLLLLTGRYYRTNAIVRERTAALLTENNERKLAEKELKKAKDKAESASHAKNQFLSHVSHELRTPLNGILGFTQLLQKNPVIKNKEKEQINLIKNCAEYLLTLINDILDISKIESQKIEIKSAPFDFKCFLYDIIAVFKLKAEERHIYLTLSEQALPESVNGDEKRLRQIFINLLSNAIKFTVHGGVSVAVSYHDGQLNLTVQDTGCGISEADYKLMFLPFVQISNPVNSEHGSGLGLSITEELIKLMRGSISCYSEVNKGSTFSVKIPLAESFVKKPSIPAKQEIIAYKGAKRSVLIVDDNYSNIIILKTLLQDLSFIVTTAENGDHCIALCAKNAPDIIFMDMMMPEFDGIETTVKLLELHPNKPPYIIGMSASVFAEEKQRFLDSGCQYFIAKPIKQDVLLECIESVLQIEWVYGRANERGDIPERRVLIADDNEINRLLLKNMLENLNCVTDTCNNGKHALELCAKYSYDLALIDLNMPGMNGIEFITTVRNQPGPNKLITMAAISAYADHDKISTAIDSGFDDYITKPIDEHRLEQLIKSIQVNKETINVD